MGIPHEACDAPADGASLTDPPVAFPATARTAAEQALVAQLRAKQAARKPYVRWKVRNTGNGNCEIYADHSDVELATAMTMEALGLTSPAALQNLMESLANNARIDGEVNEERFLRFQVYVRSVEPRDEVEAMIAVQMALAHDLSTTMARLQHNAESALQRDSASKAFNAAARTSVMQLDALKKYRSNGQKIVIERIDVKEGGQAIVGSVGRDGAGQAVVHGNDEVEVVPAAAPKPRRRKRATPPLSLTAATEDERMTVPFEAVVRPDVELVARSVDTPSPPTVEHPRTPPKVNTSARGGLRHWRRRWGGLGGRP